MINLGIFLLKETMAAVHFIISTAAKHDVDDLSLIQEIQQLGLPQESAIVIGTVFMENKEALKARLRKETCRLSRVLRTDWHVESNALATDAETKCSIQLRILLDTEPMRGPLFTGPGSGSDADPANRTLSKTGEEHNRLKDLAFNITPEKLDLLILELTQAKSIMDGLIK